MRTRMSIARLICTTVAAVLAATVAVPPTQPEPHGANDFPLRSLLAFLATPAWAVDPAVTPRQTQGAHNGVHQVPADATRANGGNGRPAGKVPHALGEYAPPQQQNRPEWTTGKQEGFVAGKSVWQAERSSRMADVYRNPDGTYTSRLHQRQVNYVGPDGKMRPINVKLTRGADGDLRVQDAPVQVTLTGGDAAADLESRVSAEQGNAIPTGSGIGEMVSLRLPKGQTIGYGLAGGLPVRPAVNGSTATYRGTLPFTDFEVTAIGVGVKANVILHSPRAGNEWIFPLQLRGLTPRVEQDGSVALLDAAGKITATIPRGYMQDAKMQGDGDFTTSDAVRYELITVKGKLALKVTADRAWLDDPARVYPITVDPSAQTWDNTGDMYVDATGVRNINSLGVGCYMASSTCDRRRSFLRFNYYDYAYGAPNNNLSGVYVTSAKLHLFHTWSEDCDTHRKIAAWQVNEGWSSSWSPNNSRYPGAGLDEWMGELHITDNRPACDNGNGDRNIAKEWVMQLTNLNPFHEWSKDANTNHGIALTTENDDDRWGWKRFVSRDFDPANGKHAPWLELTWEYNQAPVVMGQYPPHGYSSPTLTPELMTEAYDPDNWPYGMSYQFLVYDPANTTTPLADSGWTTSRSYVVPAGKLQWSKTYVWSVLVQDGYNVSANQTPNVLTTAVPSAPITSGLSQNDENGFAANVGNYTTSAVDLSIAGVGPPLSIERSYNSRDPRTAGVFGAGWSSILDAKATELVDPNASTARAIVITYPSGQDVAFGRNSDGTFHPPMGRYSTLRSVSGGYSLVDKEGTTYLFTAVKSTGVFGLTAIIDAQGRRLSLNYTAGRVTSMVSASGRWMSVGWTPDNKRVERVFTERVNEADPYSANTWTYQYDGDRLMKACTANSLTDCHRYEYASNSLYPTAVLDGSPHTYLRMNEAVGAPTAASSVVDNGDTATGVYHNVTLGRPGPLPSVSGVWSAPTAAGFNGTSSYVDFSQSKVAMKASVQSVSMWFKTTSNSGVLLSYQAQPITAGTTQHNYTPVLYIGTSGKLRGKFWDSSTSAFESDIAVNDGNWHHLALVAAGSSQTLYLDGGRFKQTIQGAVRTIDQTSTAYQYIGAGFLGGLWVDQPHYNDGTNTGYPTYFNGTIGEFAFYDRPLSEGQVKLMGAAGQAASSPLTKVIRPSGGVNASVQYDTQSGIVTQVTDANNGVWKINAPTVGGSSTVHSSAVLGAAPSDYFRLVDTRNEINGVKGTFSNVTFGGAHTGPLGETAAYFANNGSHMTSNGSSIDTSQSYSVSAWVNISDKYWNERVVSIEGNRVSPFYFGYSKGTDKWEISVSHSDVDSPQTTVVSSLEPAKLDTWTHLTATVDGASRTVKLYVDGKLQGTATAAALWKANGPLNIGRVKWNGGFSDGWKGRLAEIATYRRILSEDEVKAQVAARDKAANGGAGAGVPVKSVKVTDPGNKDTTYVYDLMAGGRQVREIDPYGAVTAFGYDTAGFLRTNTDPNGNMTINEHDVRGNVIAQTTCQNRAAQLCSTVYHEYFPDATTKVLTPDPRNDQMLKTRDGRSASATDNTYLTTFEYDAKGNRIKVTDPLGRVTTTSYTSTVATSSASCNAGESADKAFDKAWLGWDSKWCSLAADKWLQAQLPYERYLSQIVVHHAESGGEAAALNTKDYDIATSLDGTTWTTVVQQRGNVYGSVWHNISPIKAKFMKLTVLTPSNNGDAAARIYEVEGVSPPPGLPWRTVSHDGALDLAYYTHQGDLGETTDSAGLRTQFTYDKLGRTVNQKTIGGGTTLETTFEYDQLDRVVKRTDPSVLNRVTGATHRAVHTTIYDADGRVKSQTISDATGGDAARKVENEYNTLGQLISTKDAENKVRTFTYNAYGHKATETDPTGVQTAYTYDSHGRQLTTTLKAWVGDPNNPQPAADLLTESRAYDPGGRIATVTDAMGWTTVYKYTDNGLVASVTRKENPAPGVGAEFVVESNVYDAAGSLVRTTTDNGASVSAQTLDAINRVTSQTLDPGGLNRRTDLTYNDRDLVVSATKSLGASALSRSDALYDQAGRLVAGTQYMTTGLTPAARWRLNQTTGTKATADTGNVHPDTTDVAWANDAIRGQVASFNGTTSGIKSGGAVIDTTRSFSFAVWVKLAAKGADRYVATMSGASGGSALKLNYATSGDQWWLSMSGRRPDGTVGWIGAGTAAGSPKVGEWTHLAVTADHAAKELKLYVDGALSFTIPVTIPLNNHSPELIIGQEYGAGSFSGSISDFQLYQQTLTAAEVTSVRTGSAPEAGATVIRTSHAVNARGQQTSTTDPLGNVTHFAYDEAGHVAQSTTPAVQTEESGGTAILAVTRSTVGYNTFGEVVESLDPKDRLAKTLRDGTGQPVEMRLPAYTAPGSGTAITPASTLVYDGNGRVIKTVDPLLRETSHVYDQLGRLAKVVAPNGGETKFTYTLNGDQLSMVDPAGGRSESTYDYLGRVVTSTAVERAPAAAYVTNHGYDAAGRLASITPPGRNPTRFEYNALGEQVKVIDSAGNSTVTAYDFAGRPFEITAVDGAKQTVTYDAADRRTRVQSKNAAGTVLATVSATYDGNDRVLSTTDARNNSTTFTYDATGLLTQIQQPEGVITSFGYDATGAQTRFTDGRGHRYITRYNSWGLVESQEEPGGATFTFGYDAAGQQVAQTSPGGVSVTSTFNQLGRLSGQTGSGADAPTAARSFDYDLTGRLTSVTEGGATTTLSYNDRGRLTGTGGAAGTSAFAWSPDGLLTSRQDAAGTSSYTYDAAGRLSTVDDPSAGERATYAYNNLNLPTSITYGVSGNKRTFAYDDLRRLTLDSLSKSDDTVIASIGYGYDPNGNLTSKTTTGFTSAAANTYTYDKINRLVEWKEGSATTEYAYDGSGNRTKIGSRIYTYDSRNRLTSDGSATYAYAERGTLTGTTEGTVTTPSTFDAYSQQITQGTRSYTYDGLGRALTASGGVTFQYSGNGNDVASDGSATYSRDPSGDLAGVKAGGSGSFAWTDQHDDLVGQFTATSSTLNGSRAYSPLGVTLSQAGMQGNLAYQSGWTDPVTSRVNMHARWYNPATAQFASRDTATVSPIPDPARANRYSYGDGNPLTNTDPTGHFSCGWCKKAWNGVTEYGREWKASWDRGWSGNTTAEDNKSLVPFVGRKDLGYLDGAFDGLHETSKGVLTLTSHGAKCGLSGVAESCDTLNKTFSKEGLKNAWEAIKKTWKECQAGNKRSCGKIGFDVVTSLTGIGGLIKGIVSLVKTIVNGIKTITTKTTKATVTQILKTLQTQAAKQADAFKQTVKDGAAAAAAGAQKAVAAIAEALQAAKAAAASAASKTAATVGKVTTAAGKGLSDVAKLIADASKAAAAKAKAAIASAATWTVGASKFVFYKTAAYFLNVSTKRHGAVVYSGGDAWRKHAQDYANSTGRNTIEQTPGGRWLDDKGLWPKDPSNLKLGELTTGMATSIWKTMSRRFALGATGQVHMLTRGYYAKSILYNTELPNIKPPRAEVVDMTPIIGGPPAP